MRAPLRNLLNMVKHAYFGEYFMGLIVLGLQWHCKLTLISLNSKKDFKIELKVSKISTATYVNVIRRTAFSRC